VSHRAGLDRRRNSHPVPGFDPQTVQPIAMLKPVFVHPESEENYGVMFSKADQ